ncbi:MAG: 1,4-dihydroxy-2-naphthoate polyprenyltransferase [Microbacteriaceae bacterium]|nr:1,4-dihydroxy-2-naphthoate polyprenyltransferase [Microbacteriaceae bacterium]
MASISNWVSGARVRTLPLAFSPVILGSAIASSIDGFDPLIAFLALLVAVFLQLGVNYSNDYSDGVRGTDDYRLGPQRLTGSGTVEPKKVLYVAFGFFALAAFSGLVIVVLTAQWWLLLIGVLAILAAWYYTGGKDPYGYAGLGELSVFIFFGPVATVGTSFAQTLVFQADALIAGIGLGLFAAAVLVTNNIRDIETDKQAGKRTLAVFMGSKASKVFYLVLIWIPMVITLPFVVIYPATIISWLVLLLVIPLSLLVPTAKKPKELITGLKLTSYASVAWAVTLSIGISLVSF